MSGSGGSGRRGRRNWIMATPASVTAPPISTLPVSASPSIGTARTTASTGDSSVSGTTRFISCLPIR